jgi:hypothetical protein
MLAMASALRPQPKRGLRNRPFSAGSASSTSPTEAGLREATLSRMPRAARVSSTDSTTGSATGIVSSATCGHTVPSRSHTTSLTGARPVVTVPARPAGSRARS